MHLHPRSWLAGNSAALDELALKGDQLTQFARDLRGSQDTGLAALRLEES